MISYINTNRWIWEKRGTNILIEHLPSAQPGAEHSVFVMTVILTIPERKQYSLFYKEMTTLVTQRQD